MRVGGNISRQESPVSHKIAYASATKEQESAAAQPSRRSPFFWRGCMRIELIRQVLSLPQTVLKTAGHTSTHPPPWKSYSYKRRPGRRRSALPPCAAVPVKTFQHQQRTVARGAEEVAEGRERERLVVGKISAHERAGAHVDLAVQAEPRRKRDQLAAGEQALEHTLRLGAVALRQSGRARGPCARDAGPPRGKSAGSSVRRAVWRLV